MPFSRKEKQRFIDTYNERLQRSEAVVILRNNGLTVSEITALRRKLQEADAYFQITKNTLFKIALRDSRFPIPEDMFKGTVGVCYVNGPVSTAAKILNDYMRDQKKLETIGALLPEEVLNAEEAAALVDLPTREQALASLLGTVQGPLTNLVGVLQAPLRELITVLHARGEQEAEAVAA